VIALATWHAVKKPAPTGLYRILLYDTQHRLTYQICFGNTANIAIRNPSARDTEDFITGLEIDDRGTGSLFLQQLLIGNLMTS